ncbi:12173_t:CDS:2 [Acaulospora morrowiae]|uniref:Postreplication repair E3 ubiquitin-protein ligase RAD18 n=1 Tax=Acaulospora morrowiae TaxID=94023 RepID=A0A9N9AAV4_9GLOM|nr:12173_t:CDS:2 [Acaulospora morrowiae]
MSTSPIHNFTITSPVVSSENTTDPATLSPISQQSSLASLEQYLRCPVCGDYYDLPMSAKCQHTFCAGCIKSNFENKVTALECPVCGHEFTSFAQLCKNSVIEDFVREYRKLRLSTVQLYKLGLQVENRVREEGEQKLVIPPVAEINSRIDDVSSQSITQESESEVPRNSSKSTLPLCPVKRSNSIDLKRSMSNDEADVPAKRIKGEDNEMTVHGNKGNINNKPKSVYVMLKDKKLKEMLKEEGLPVTGGRSDWQKRHEYFIHLWNSNVDATKPKTKEELIRDVKQWERAQQSGAARTASDIKRALNTDEEIKSYDILLSIVEMFSCFVFDGLEHKEKQEKSLSDEKSDDDVVNALYVDASV